MGKIAHDKKHAYWLILAITVAALCIRLYALGSESFWLDESYQLYISGQPSAFEVIRSMGNDTMPPLFHLLLHFWLLIFGQSEFWVRLLPALLGTLAVPAVYALAKELFDNRTALMAATLIAFTPIQVAYSQEARPYALFTLLTILSFHYLARYLKTGSKGDRIAYIAATSLMLYTHYYSLFFIGAQFIAGIWLLRKQKRRIVRFITTQFFCALIFALWIPMFISHAEPIQRGIFWIKHPDISELQTTATQLAGGQAQLIILASLILASQIFEGISPLLLAWIILPIAVPFTYSYFLKPFFMIRYVLPVSAAISIAAARGASIAKKTGVALIILYLIICIQPIYDNATRIKKEQWRDVAEMLKLERKTGEPIIVHQNYAWVALLPYYKQDTIQFPTKHSSFTQKDVDDLLSSIDARHVWLVYSHGNEKSKPLIESLTKKYPHQTKYKFTGITLYKYDSQIDATNTTALK